MLKLKSGEKFTALDNKNYKLDDGMCVISDNKGVLGLGGIIGGTVWYRVRYKKCFLESFILIQDLLEKLLKN